MPELDDAVGQALAAIAEEIADMISDWYGRSTIDADRDLAMAILARLTIAGAGPDKVYRDPTYGWHLDEPDGPDPDRLEREHLTRLAEEERDDIDRRLLDEAIGRGE